MKLRAANVRFLPTSSAEILHHLRTATDDSGAVVETVALRTLRRYMATCTIQGDILQGSIGSSADWNTDEGTYLLDTARAVTLALLGLWKDTAIDDRVRQARAERVLRALYVEHHGLMATASVGRPDVSDHHRAAASMASMLAHAIDMPANIGSDEYVLLAFNASDR